VIAVRFRILESSLLKDVKEKLSQKKMLKGIYKRKAISNPTARKLLIYSSN